MTNPKPLKDTIMNATQSQAQPQRLTTQPQAKAAQQLTEAAQHRQAIQEAVKASFPEITSTMLINRRKRERAAAYRRKNRHATSRLIATLCPAAAQPKP
jgi:hypothetical protein